MNKVTIVSKFGGQFLQCINDAVKMINNDTNAVFCTSS